MCIFKTLWRTENSYQDKTVLHREKRKSPEDGSGAKITIIKPVDSEDNFGSQKQTVDDKKVRTEVNKKKI